MIASNINKLIQEGLQFEDAGNLSRAADCFQNTIDLDIKQPEWVFTKLGHLYQKIQNYEKAKKIYLIQISIYPSSSNAYANLALIAHNKQELDKALEYWETCFTKHIGDVPNWWLVKKGHVLLEMNQLKAAKKTFEEAIQQSPSNVWSYDGMIKIAQKLKDTKLELQIFQTIVEDFPNHDINHFRYGVLLRERGYHDKAEQYFQHLLSTKKQDKEKILKALAWTARESKNFEVAAKRWETLVKQYPTNIFYCRMYILTLLDLLQFKDAQLFYQKNLPTHHNQPDYLLLQAIIYWEQAQKEKALKEINTLQTNYPKHIPILSKKIDFLIQKFKSSGIATQLPYVLDEWKTLKPLIDHKHYERVIINLCILLGHNKEALEHIAQIPDNTKVKKFMEYKAWAAYQAKDVIRSKAIWRNIINWHFVPQVKMTQADSFNRLDKKEIDIKENAILVFTVVKNERWRLPWFLEYYRNLGVDRFFFIDNNSDDGTTEYLLKQKDVYVFWTNQSYAKAHSGMKWVNDFIERYGNNCWCLYVDVDEALVFPNIENRKLSSLTNYLSYYGYEAVYGFMLDMYATNLQTVPMTNNYTNFLADYPLFDNRYDKINALNCPYQHITGGIRRRIFETQEIQTKTPIIRGGKGIKFLMSSHEITPAQLADVTCVLLHYKLAGDFNLYFENDLKNNDRLPNCNKRHWTYIQYLKNNTLDELYSEHTCTYQSSQQLVELGLLTTSSNFELEQYD